MVDGIAAENFFKELNKTYIQPEVAKRSAEGKLPPDFKIYQFRILDPYGDKAVVEFNDEIGWLIAEPVLAPGVTMEIGNPVYLHESVEIGKVLPPEIDGQRVAFVFVYWNGFQYKGVIDFTPNSADFDPKSTEFLAGDTIRNYLTQLIREYAVKSVQAVQAEMLQIGLWPATCLIPYPLSKIVERLGAGKSDEARDILIKFCEAGFLKRLIETWGVIDAFQSRMGLFRETVLAHQQETYHLSIYALVPQIEGVISDWLSSNPNIAGINWGIASRIRQFSQLIEAVPQFEYTWREAITAGMQFILDGPVLSEFKNWLDAVDPSFAGRNPTTHGRYESAMFTEENSIKLFLLLDTICQFMMFYEVRVLGRDLVQK